MIALGLVHVIERHSDELAAELIAKLETSSRTTDLRKTSSKKQQEVPWWRRKKAQRVLLQIRLSNTTGFDEDGGFAARDSCPRNSLPRRVQPQTSQ